MLIFCVGFEVLATVDMKSSIVFLGLFVDPENGGNMFL
jgi:hypothetical protein